MQIVKKGLKYTAVFCIAVMILTGLLVLTAKIPRSAIKENVQKSAEYLCEAELFATKIEGVEGSRIDRYADSILVAIAYQYDAEHPMASVMKSAYYHTEYQNENENLLHAVEHGLEANQQYLRYWHGSNAVLRPLLIFFELSEIYVVMGVLLVVLILTLLWILRKRGAYVPIIGLVAGLVATSVWFVPFSLEYIWTYLLMLLVCIVGIKLVSLEKWQYIGYLFLLSGILTNYVDFLTTETLTLLIPLLLFLWMDRRAHPEKKAKQHFKKAGVAVISWGCGYVFMWITKWILASVVLEKNVMPYVTDHVKERMGLEHVSYIIKAWKNNISCLFPYEYGTVGVLIGILGILIAFYLGYVYHKKNICRDMILLYGILGLIPYVRYMILLNHSYLHFFFTYRAQMAMIFAVVLILEELTDRRWLARATVRKRKP